MKIGAWAWAIGLMLLGWVPTLLLAYGITFAIAVGTGTDGPLVFGAIYFGMLAACLFLLTQVRQHFGLHGPERQWFSLAGGGGLILVWTVAYAGFRVWTGAL